MPSEIVLQQRPDEALLSAQRVLLTALRQDLAEREAELARMRAVLQGFESRYFRQVGVLYAALDDLEARIAEREVDLYDSDESRRRAEEARSRANEAHEAAYEPTSEAEAVEATPGLKTLFREVAKRIHPDLAQDAAEGEYLTLLMARANQAYRRGDAEMLQRLLEDNSEAEEVAAGEGCSAELLRVRRQMQHARRDLASLSAEQEALRSSEIAQMHADAERAALEHRDLLAELAAAVREQIAEAQRRWEFVDRQIRAHGR